MVNHLQIKGFGNQNETSLCVCCRLKSLSLLGPWGEKPGWKSCVLFSGISGFLLLISPKSKELNLEFLVPRKSNTPLGNLQRAWSPQTHFLLPLGIAGASKSWEFVGRMWNLLLFSFFHRSVFCAEAALCLTARWEVLRDLQCPENLVISWLDPGSPRVGFLCSSAMETTRIHPDLPEWPQPSPLELPTVTPSCYPTIPGVILSFPFNIPSSL